jgi:hypothetical protein
MKQTAIHELISEMEQLKKTKLYTGSFKAIEDCLCLAYAKLEMEKQQIIDAHGSKLKNSRGTSNFEYWYTGEQYYNETYKKQ